MGTQLPPTPRPAGIAGGLAAAGAWLKAAKDGYCEQTGMGLEQGGAGNMCGKHDKGTFVLSSRAYQSFPKAVRACTRLCRSCERCRYISVSLKWQDCSWYYGCPNPKTDVKGFRSGPVQRRAAGERRRERGRLPGLGPQFGHRSGPSEIVRRYTQLLSYSPARNTSGLERLVQHPRIAPSLHRGVHLGRSGRRWDKDELEAYASLVYRKHKAQSDADRAALTCAG
jgi:hypothetical protein